MAQPQYTPSQVLETARRAEAEGQIDYADQAFRHILEVFPTSQEAAIARDAIAKRQYLPNGSSDLHPTRTPSLTEALQAPLQSQAPPQATIPGNPSPLPHTNQQRPQNTQYESPTSNRAPAQTNGNSLQLEPVASTEGTSRGASFALPYHRNYPFARFLATLTIILGVLTLLVAALVGVTSVLNPNTVQVLTGTPLLVPNILYSLSIFGSGLILCLVGLLAHAVFHTARNLTTYTTAEHARLKRRDT